MNVKFSHLLWMLMVVIAAFGLYMVKYRVQHIKRDLATVEQKIKEEQEALHIINAEWAYLNRPERLSELAERHLKLVPMQGGQIVELAELPRPGQQLAELQPAAAPALVPASVPATGIAPLTQLPDGMHDE